jgi:hypothetical protein
MVDPVEAFCHVGIEDIFGFMAHGREHGFDRIVTGSARTKSRAVGFKTRFPFRLERGFDQGLEGTVCHHGDAEGPLLDRVGCRDPDPADRLGFLPKPQGVDQCESLGGRQCFDPVDTRGLLAVMLLGHLPYGS